MVSINPGDLRHKIEFYTLDRVQDEGGGFSATEVFAFSTLAKVEQKTSKRATEAGGMALYSYYNIIIRYSKDKLPLPDMIIKHKGKSLLVNAITDMDENQMLIALTCGKS